MASAVIDLAALSRPFTLGMLYDARKEQIIPGVTMWDEKTLQEMTVQNDQPSCNFQVTTFDSVEAKSSMLDVSAALKASFLGGLIEVEGSAKYLNDKKESHNQARVTFQYQATTFFKQLMLPPFKTENTLKIDDDVKSLATHVITGILYGANAFFVFDSEKVEASNVQDIEGNMKALIKMIPLTSIEGEAQVKFTDEENALKEQCTCKFYGDFLLKDNPTTFQEAVKTYTKLPSLLGENNEHSIPVKVWMIPLKSLDPSAAELMTEIDPDLVRKAQNALEDCHDLIMRCNDCLESSYHFPQTEKRLKRFQELCFHYTAKLQDILAKHIPAIRAGKIDETVLQVICDTDNKDSPFNTEKLKKWISNMEREITVISSCLEMMEKGKIIPNQAKLDAEIFDPKGQDVVCFAFTSLETTDPFLQNMFDRLDSKEMTQVSLDPWYSEMIAELRETAKTFSLMTPVSPDPWYFSEEVITEMREKAKTFGNIAADLTDQNRYKFLVSAITDEKPRAATVYQYKNAIKLSEDFIRPDVEKITDRHTLLNYDKTLTLDPDTAQKNLILSEGNKRVTHGDPQSYPDVRQRFDPLPQVLGTETLNGHHYWEVELTNNKGDDVAVGVCYEGIGRKGLSDGAQIGGNSMSWSLRFFWPLGPEPTPQGPEPTPQELEPTLQALHDKIFFNYSVPFSGCTRLGVDLNWPEGILSFYIVMDDKVHHVHTFKTKFTEPVYPCFTITSPNSSIKLTL